MYLLGFVCMLVCWVCEGVGSFAGARCSLADIYRLLQHQHVCSGAEVDVADQNGRTACGIPTCGVLKLQDAWYNWLKLTAKAPCKLVIRERNEDVQQNSMSIAMLVLGSANTYVGNTTTTIV